MQHKETLNLKHLMVMFTAGAQGMDQNGSTCKMEKKDDTTSYREHRCLFQNFCSLDVPLLLQGAAYPI